MLEMSCAKTELWIAVKLCQPNGQFNETLSFSKWINPQGWFALQNKPTNNPIRPHNILWYTFFDQMAEYNFQSQKEKKKKWQWKGKVEKETMYFSAVQVNEM